jgi:hypothetical protein
LRNRAGTLEAEVGGLRVLGQAGYIVRSHLKSPKKRWGERRGEERESGQRQRKTIRHLPAK